MKVLVEVRHEDTFDTEFTSCGDCAVARAVKRVVKKGLYVAEGGSEVSVGTTYNIYHEDFDVHMFSKLKDTPGSFHVLEMNIPKEYLRQEYLNDTIPARNVVKLKKEVNYEI